MKLTTEYLRTLIKESLQEVETNVSGFYQDREASDPTPESFAGPEMFVLMSDDYDGSEIYGVFDSFDGAVAAAKGIVESGKDEATQSLHVIKLKSNIALEQPAERVEYVVSKAASNR